MSRTPSTAQLPSAQRQRFRDRREDRHLVPGRDLPAGVVGGHLVQVQGRDPDARAEVEVEGLAALQELRHDHVRVGVLAVSGDDGGDARLLHLAPGQPGNREAARQAAPHEAQQVPATRGAHRGPIPPAARRRRQSRQGLRTRTAKNSTSSPISDDVADDRHPEWPCRLLTGGCRRRSPTSRSNGADRGPGPSGQPVAAAEPRERPPPGIPGRDRATAYREGTGARAAGPPGGLRPEPPTSGARQGRGKPPGPRESSSRRQERRLGQHSGLTMVRDGELERLAPPATRRSARGSARESSGSDERAIRLKNGARQRVAPPPGTSRHSSPDRRTSCRRGERSRPRRTCHTIGRQLQRCRTRWPITAPTRGPRAGAPRCLSGSARRQARTTPR